jgi:hypothetical protein
MGVVIQRGAAFDVNQGWTFTHGNRVKDYVINR